MCLRETSIYSRNGKKKVVYIVEMAEVTEDYFLPFTLKGKTTTYYELVKERQEPLQLSRIRGKYLIGQEISISKNKDEKLKR